MIPLFYKVYFKRIAYFTIFLQIACTISFLLFQMPHFLGIMKGMKWGIENVILIMVLRTLEWVNFIFMMTFLSILLLRINSDLLKNNLNIMLLQMGVNEKFLIKPMMLISIIYAVFFFAIDGFCLPISKVYFKRTFIELTKQSIVSSMQPSHIICYKDWNYGISERHDRENISGIILNKENDPKLTLLIKHAAFDSKTYMYLQLKDGVGKITHNEHNLIFRFKSGKFSAPSAWVHVQESDEHLTLHQLARHKLKNWKETNWQEIIKRFRMAIASLAIPFFIFTFIFGSVSYTLLALASYGILMFFAMDILPFSLIGMITPFLFLYLIYRTLIRSKGLS